MHLFICLSWYASIHLSIHPPFTHVLPYYFIQSPLYSFVHLSTYQPLHLSINLSIFPHIHPSTSIIPFISLPISICLFILLANYPSIHPLVHLPFLSFPSIHTAIFVCPPIHSSLSIPFIHLPILIWIHPPVHSFIPHLLTHCCPQFKHLCIYPPTYSSMHSIVLTNPSTLSVHLSITQYPFIYPSLLIPLFSPIHSFTHLPLDLPILSTF